MDLCTSFEKEVKKYDLSQLWCPCTGNVCEYCGAALPYNDPDHVHIDNSRNTVNVIYNNNYYIPESAGPEDRVCAAGPGVFAKKQINCADSLLFWDGWAYIDFM